jgi:hypothetical protein
MTSLMVRGTSERLVAGVSGLELHAASSAQRTIGRARLFFMVEQAFGYGTLGATRMLQK